MQAIITVIGRDKPGILAAVSSCCFQSGVNIIDITQTIMDRMFVMVMHTGMEGMNCGFDQFTQRMQDVAERENLRINVMNRQIFDAMHNV